MTIKNNLNEKIMHARFFISFKSFYLLSMSKDVTKYMNGEYLTRPKYTACKIF